MSKAVLKYVRYKCVKEEIKIKKIYIYYKKSKKNITQ